jgi:cytochrome c biogenesis protein CcmG/thiol:disulfide interchange protein DsbE
MLAQMASLRGCWVLLIGALVALGLGETNALGGNVAPPGLITVSSGTPMPAFQLPAIDGSTTTSADLRGKVVIVRFWATW